MATYIGSPWGTMKGKLNGSVGGSYKGINWVRVLKDPTQKGTLELYRQYKETGLPVDFSFAQMNLRRVVTSPLGYIGRTNLQTFIFPIWERLCKLLHWKMSGANALIKLNANRLLNSMPDKTTEFEPDTNSPDLKEIYVSDGDLEGTNSLTAVYDTATGDLVLTWDTSIFKNGLATDYPWFVVFKKPIIDYGTDGDGSWLPTLFMYGPWQAEPPAVPAQRDDGTETWTLPDGLDADDLTAFIFFVDGAPPGTIGWSRSQSCQVTAAP
jgi:hypothetical protein